MYQTLEQRRRNWMRARCLAYRVTDSALSGSSRHARNGSTRHISYHRGPCTYCDELVTWEGDNASGAWMTPSEVTIVEWP